MVEENIQEKKMGHIERVKHAFNKRVEMHIFEKVILGFMTLFAIAAVYILVQTLTLRSQNAQVSSEFAYIEMFIIVIMSIFIQTIVLIRIYENTKK